MSSAPPEFSLSMLLNAARNHWLAGSFVMLVTMCLAVLAMIFLPRSYHSEAMIFVKLGRETVSLDPTASTGNRVSVLESRDNEINSIRDMLYSRNIMEQVADRIGPEVILGDAPLSDENFESNYVPGTDYKDSPRQKAILELSENTDVVNSRKSSVLTITTQSKSPELAQRILKEYLEVYLGMHRNAHQTPQSNQFFEKQAKLLKVQWQEAMKSLQITKEDAGVVSIQGAKDNLKFQTNEAESALMSVESNLASSRAKLERFETIISKNPLDQQRVRDEFLATKGEMSAMSAEKEALQSQLEEMLDKAAKLNRNEVSIGGLEQEVAMAAANFAQYENLHEQTRIEQALDTDRFTNVRIVQQPSFVPKPVSPRKTLIGLAGLVAGTAGAVLIAVFLEIFMGPTHPEQKEEQLAPDPDYPANDEFTATEAEMGIAREVADAANG
jgi:uncharacterized protein involved in exopolysaccharide biosynthesis